MGAPAGDMGAPAGDTGPLAEEKDEKEEKKEPVYRSESNKFKILSMLSEDTSLTDLFDDKRARDNIYEMDKVISDILEDNAEGENKLIKEQTDD